MSESTASTPSFGRHLRTWRALRARVHLPRLQMVTVVLMSVLASFSEFLSIALIQPVLVLFSGQDVSGEITGFQLSLVTWLEAMGTSGRILVLVGLVIVLQVLREALLFVSELVSIRIRTAFELRCRELVYQKCLSMPLDLYKRTPSGDFHNIISAFPRSASGYVFSSLSMIPQLFMVSVYMVLMWMMEGWLLLVVAFVAIVVLVGMRGAYARQTRYGRQMRDALSDTATCASELVEALAVIRAFGQEQRMQAVYGGVARRYLDANAASSIINAAIGPLQRVLTLLTILVSMTVFFLLSGAEERSFLATLIVFLIILARLNGPLSAINLQRAGLAQLLPFVDRLNAFLDTRVREEGGGAPPPPSFEQLALEDVSFSYTSGAPVLHEFTLTVRKGEFVALVGPSGAGKSTVAALTCGFETPVRGRVTVNGQDLAGTDLQQWRRRVGVVPQSPYMFDVSIRDNIRFGRPEASDAEVLAAARSANAMDFIEALRDGLDTPTGEGGDLLSGGQVQRLALARALLLEPDLLILDEATSAQDPTSEARIRATLGSLRGCIALVVIAHRLSTIRNADRIVVLDHGRLMETGSHDELVRAGGLYARMLRQGQERPEAEEPPTLGEGGAVAEGGVRAGSGRRW